MVGAGSGSPVLSCPWLALYLVEWEFWHTVASSIAKANAAAYVSDASANLGFVDQLSESRGHEMG
jgi:hypothetical protein